MPENNQLPEALTNPARRSVVKAAAWAVPVIAAATAVPLAAASGTDPLDTPEMLLYITAFNVKAGGAGAYVESNGIRISPADPSKPALVPAGTIFTITVTYKGSNPEQKFTNPTSGVQWNKDQNHLWDSVKVTKNTLTFTFTSKSTTTEPTTPAFHWQMVPGRNPGEDSVVVTGNATIPPGGDFPNWG